MPAEVMNYVPEAKYYAQLRDTENEMEAIVKSKKIDLEELTTQPAPHVKTMLLLHIYNVHYNQSNPFTITNENAIKVPAWNLRLQGKVLFPKLESFEELPSSSPYIKMTHFIRKLEISFNKEQVNYPDIEWNKEATSQDAPMGEDKDGIEIIREGDKELDLLISLHVNYSPKQFKVKPELSSIIGIRQCTKMQAMAALWEYVKSNKLQDQQEHRLIVCNRELRLVILSKHCVVNWERKHRILFNPF